MTSRALLICRDLHKSFGRLQVLRGGSLELREAELVGLVGENGSGKSTFVRCLLGFTRVDSGTLMIRGPVGYCPQDSVLHRRYRVCEHLELMAAIYGRRGPIDHEFTESVLDRLNLRPFLRTRIGELSGGTYQKVKFLTSIYHSPRLIILDEPYDGFDWNMYLAFWDILAELKSRGASMLMISHLIFDRKHFDRIYELKEGCFEKTQE